MNGSSDDSDSAPSSNSESTSGDRNAETASQNDHDDFDEEELLYETIAAGRGHRDEVGMRDQWSSTEHLGVKFDSKTSKISPRVQALLKSYRLECNGCRTEQDAIMKINTFVIATKAEAQRLESRQLWQERAVSVITVLVVILAGWLVHARYRRRKNDALSAAPRFGIGGYSIGRSSATTADANTRRIQIEAQRRRAALLQQNEAAAPPPPPTWRENEELEIWTAAQEKQFHKALVCFGGVPPKARYILIADKVDGKNRLECLMHHKLLQAMAKDE